MSLRVKRATPDVIVSHWCKLIENFSFSSRTFYEKLDQAISKRQIPNINSGQIHWPEGSVLSAKRIYLRLVRERLVIDICAAPFGTGFFVSWRLGEIRLRVSFFLLFLLLCSCYWLYGSIYDRYSWDIYRFRHRYPGEFLGIIVAVVAVFFLILFFLRQVVASGLSDLDAVLLRIPILGPFYERFLRPITYYRIDLMLAYQEAVHQAVLEVVDEITTTGGIKPLSELERRPILTELYKRRR